MLPPENMGSKGRVLDSENGMLDGSPQLILIKLVLDNARNNIFIYMEPASHPFLSPIWFDWIFNYINSGVITPPFQFCSKREKK